MDLSNDLISQFVKITNDNSTGSKESTVYGTTVEYNGEMYVKIDGSDLLTPVETTTDMQPDERVTIMIKDHSATVTGNITSPSANAGTVDKKVTEAVDGIEGKVITEVEILIADRVSTEQLDAELARIDTLIAGKATIEDLEAIDAKIENLDVENLDAVNAEIENLKANKAEINDLKATNAEIEILDAEFADIKTLVNGNLTSDNILSFHITADKVTMADAFINDAMIANVSAGKITSGSINTSLVSVQSEDGSLIINGSTQQFKDSDGNVRIQIGKDSTGDFTFVLYGADGKGQLINQNGITASAIGDGLIVNDMVSDNAAISGGKLDISSVITEINNDNSTTIKSSKVYLNDQEQSLEVAFNSLKTQVETIQDITVGGDLSSVIEQVQTNTTQIEINKNSINTLVGEDTIIKEQISDLDGNVIEMNETLTAKYASLEQSLDGFKTSVADTYATKSTVNNLSGNLATNYSTTSAMNSAISQSATDITSTVSKTYATKESVTNLSNNLTTNYSTTTAMNSAISQSASGITATVSSTYQKKSDMSNYPTTTQMNTAITQSASNITSTVSSTYQTKSDMSSYPTTTQMNSAITQSATNLTSTISKTYASKVNLDSEVSALESSISTVEQTADKINWIVKSGTSSTNMTLTDKVYSLVSSNITLTAERINLLGYVTANGGFSIDTSGNMTAVNGEFSGNITGSTFSSANDVFQVLDDGTINTDDIVINNSISASTLNIDSINNKEYPRSMSRATNVYINQNATTVNDGEFVHNGVYSSIDALKAVAPRNLNGYNLAIYLSANYNGDIRLDNFHSGQINFNMQGYTVYGYMYFYGNSIVARVYGNMSTATGTGIMGSIMPYTGVTAGSYVYGLYFNYCTWSVTDVKLYADKTNTTNSSGIVCERCMGAVYNVSAMGSGAMRYLVRAQYHSHVYVSSTSGLCNNATFVATTGSYVGFNETDTQAGTTSSSPTWSGSGGTIAKTGVSFEATANSGSNTNTGVKTTKTVTYTGTANTYRTSSYVGWKNDNTARQGTWGYGNCTGCWFFGDAFEGIANKNVTKVVIEFARQSGGYYAAVEHKIYTHNYESKPSGAPTLGTSLGTVSVAVGGTAQLTITNATLISAIKAAKGIGMRHTYSTTYYSVCSSGMRVIFYYTE